MRTAWSMVLVLVAVAFVPAVDGYHLSIGSQDSALVAPSEGPTDPSVTASDITRGKATGCYEPTGEPDAAADEAEAALEADAFCGRLVFNQGTEFQQSPTKDQDLRGPIGTFDVVYASYVGNYGLSWNVPWATVRPAYEAMHDAGHTLGLTDDGATAWEGDQGWQEYALNFLYPNALLAAQEGTGLWEMNGWSHTIHDQQFMAFLADGAGNTITPAALAGIVSSARTGGDLAGDASPQVCGFTDDFRITIQAAQAGFCEVIFAFADENIDPDAQYADSCASPAYICGTLTPAWYAQLVCKTFLWLGSINVGSFGCAGDSYLTGGDGAAWSDNDYDVWHFVVAPTQSDCGGLQEPGFAFGGTGGNWPYLAYDLDVYSPAATAGGLRQTESLEDFARTFADENTPEVSTGGVAIGPLLPTEVWKTDKIEPNSAGDTSRSAISESRTADPCAVINPSADTHIDPWVDYVDSIISRDFSGDVLAGGSLGLFLNSDPNQDGSNRPGPGLMFSTGNVGVFTDMNDDGDYDTSGSTAIFDNIYRVGAYPLYWDLFVDPATGDPAPELGCRPGFGTQKLTGQLLAAGYGKHTGLIQVVSLAEPTLWYHLSTDDVIPYLEGDQTFVLMSQGLHALRKQGDATVLAAIQAALGKLPTPVPLADVIYPAEDLGTTTSLNDFEDQCSEDTGGFTSAWDFFHSCQLGCAGDTVVTTYLFEVTRADGTLGGGASEIPAFAPGNEPFAFGQGLHTWYDVDPLDNDPSRNFVSAPPPSD